jgi:anti-sigma regulatory factor (Ser/Thr protein kinase)
VSPFHHEALPYDSPDAFLAQTVPFIREGLAAREPVMVAVDATKIARLRERLGPEAERVRFEDMTELGRNPGRIIPAWYEFLDEHGRHRAIRGIGEPVWAGRRADELIECQLHEALLNVAFADADGFRLVCPYDTSALRDDVLHEAECSHPVVAGRASTAYRGSDDPLAPFEAPLPPPPAGVETFAFEDDMLDEVRALVAARGERAGLDPAATQDLVLAVNELASNSVRHGGGRGVLRMWNAGGELCCDVRDRGRIRDPLVGRRRRTAEEIGGWGMRIVHQVSDLVQVRSGADGTVVRLRVDVAAASQRR